MSLSLLTTVLLASAAMADEAWDTKEVREVQARFGECVIKRHYQTARQFVLAPNLDEKDYQRAASKVADGYCLVKASESSRGVEMKFPADTMRYALADALVQREFSAGPVSTFANSAPLEKVKFDEKEHQPKPGKKLKPAELKELEEHKAKHLVAIFLAGFGECVVRAEPVQSHSLLMTKPGSSEENAAFAALRSRFGNCIVTGQTLSFSKTALRGTIAMNYYRLAHAPRIAATPAGASK